MYTGVGEYYYRGEYVNNYVKIGKDLWRVLSIKRGWNNDNCSK
ncbi:MAG: hypothetical protein V8Q71_04100 [Bacilli bacterium]